MDSCNISLSLKLFKIFSVKSGAGAIPINPCTFFGYLIAFKSIDHPPIDEPTKITGSFVNSLIIKLASSAQSPIPNSEKFPSD